MVDQGTFANVRAEVVRFDGANDPLACFVGVDVQGVQVFADVVHGFEFWVDGGADVRLDTEVLTGEVWMVSWGVGECAQGVGWWNGR